MTNSNWTPLFEHEEALEHRSVVEATLTELLVESNLPSDDPSLAGGLAGTALLCGYAAQVLGQPGLGSQSESLLTRALDGLAKHATSPALHGGFCGVAWVRAHLARLRGLEETDADYAEIDEALLHHLRGAPQIGGFDLIRGAVGFGIYALERGADSGSRPVLDAVLAHLLESCEQLEAGIAWRTPHWELAPKMRSEHPHGGYNLGAAHGVPAVLALLARAHAEGALSARGQQLLARGVDWLSSCRRNFEQGTWFPSWTFPGVEIDGRGSRIAWCYGDLGLAAALLVVGKSCERADWIGDAIAIARNCASIRDRRAGVHDHGLCHGSAGIAHLFLRMHYESGDPLLGDAARFWFGELLRTREPQGIGGFVRLRPHVPGSVDPGPSEYGHYPDARFLTGSTGVALALLAGIGKLEPEWDRCLGVSD